MAQTSWPFDGQPVQEDQWTIMARQWAATGVIGLPGGEPLQVWANSSGRQVFVRPGHAILRGHFYASDAEVVLPVDANPSGSPRVDRVVLRLDPTADSITLAIKPGAPSGSPSPPAVTVTDTAILEIPLAQVQVGASAVTIAAGNVTDERLFTGAPPVVTVSNRRPVDPRLGQQILETDTGATRWWNGTSWELVTAPYLLTAGGSMLGTLNMGGNKITNLPNGTAPDDAVNRAQLNTKLDSARVVSGVVAVTTDGGGLAWFALPASPTGRWAVTVQRLTGASAGQPVQLHTVTNTGCTVYCANFGTYMVLHYLAVAY